MTSGTTKVGNQSLPAALEPHLIWGAHERVCRLVVVAAEDRGLLLDALAQERRRLRDVESIGGVGWWELDLRTRAVTWSAGLFELYGLDPDQFSGDYAAALECIHPQDQAPVNAGVEECMRSGRPLRVRYRINRHDDGSLRWIDSRGQAQYQDGERIRIVGAIADVTEHVHAHAQALAAETFHQAVVEASPDIIFVYDVSTESMTWANRSVPELLGYPEATAAAGITAFLNSVVHPDDRGQLPISMRQLVSAPAGEVLQMHHRLLAADGDYRWFSRRIAAMHDDMDAGITRAVGVLRDITDAVNIEQRLQHSALHDTLTGLPNRALLMDRLAGALQRSAHLQRAVSVLFCDLDGFKRVNDTAGHAVGDQVLIEIARRMRNVVRPGDTVARISGDEFVVVVEPWNRDGQSPDVPEQHSDHQVGISIAERIGQALRPPIIINGNEHVISASIGITHSSQSPVFHSPSDHSPANHAPAARPHSTSPEDLLQDADAAMYRAKSLGKDRFEVFIPGMRADAGQRNRIEQLLRQALRNPAGAASPPAADGHHSAAVLGAAFQPIFSGTTGALLGFEALARLTDAQGRFVGPDEFIPIAEDTGMIRALGARMLELACQQLAKWRSQHPRLAEVTMAVNISALQARDPSLAIEVHGTLSRAGLRPEDLILELTESALLDAGTSTLQTLRGLHQDGVGIAIDDFGTGFSSLQYLVTLPLSSLKIDRSFTAGLPENKISQKIVQAVAGLAAELDLTCVVEGVETAEQRDTLPPGVQIQGYLLGRPQHPDLMDFSNLLAGPEPRRVRSQQADVQALIAG